MPGHLQKKTVEEVTGFSETALIHENDRIVRGCACSSSCPGDLLVEEILENLNKMHKEDPDLLKGIFNF